MDNKLRKGQVVSYHHNGNDETFYFGIVLSNTTKVLRIQSLDGPTLFKNIDFVAEEKLALRITVYTVQTKTTLEKLLEEHRKYGLKEAKQYLKESNSSDKKELKHKVKFYKDLKFFYKKMVEIPLPE